MEYTLLDYSMLIVDLIEEMLKMWTVFATEPPVGCLNQVQVLVEGLLASLLPQLL